MEDTADRRHALRKSQLIEFSNVAAGHDGVLSSQSGDLIVKPCKNSEVTFYQQTWKWEPDATEFAYYMPKFYGTLNLQEHTPSSVPSANSAAETAAISPTALTSAVSPTLTSPTALISPTENRRASNVSNRSAPGTPKSTASHAGHQRSSSRTSMISHVPVEPDLAPTKPPKSWEPTHGAKIQADTAVVLENVAAGLHKPNILDVKIGARLWADDAHPAKRQKLDKVASETTSGSLNFRIAGMKVWEGKDAFEKENRNVMDSRGNNKQQQQSATSVRIEARKDSHGLPLPTIGHDDYASYDREYGRAMKTETVQLGFKEYFFRPQAGVSITQSREIVQRFIEDIQGLIDVMSTLETRMYSASLLFVYEGDGQALKQDFRRENRMLKEIRLAQEDVAAGMQSVAIEELNASDSRKIPEAEDVASSHSKSGNEFVETRSDAPKTQPQLTLTKPAASEGLSGAPVLPDIDSVGSGLDVPLQLLLSDEQLSQGGNDKGDLVFENDSDKDDDDQDPERILPKIQAMKVIDFAHATKSPGHGPDENFLTGIKNVLKILEEILASSSGNQGDF